MSRKHYLSKIFNPIINIPKSAGLTRQDISSKSQRLMLELGIIQQAHTGSFHFLPLGLKSLNKLVQIVDEEMYAIGGQKVLFPSLINNELWNKSGRLTDGGPELFQLKDRHSHGYILAPTHEEAAANLISTLPIISYKNFPLKLYQITTKYRDEMKPRFGLMRGKEFIMKDMYSFDIDMDSARKTYEEICNSYDRIFRKIGIDYKKVLGTAGNIGGSLTHEYQFKAQIGEDSLVSCTKCNFAANRELHTSLSCPNCGEDTKLFEQSGIEVGHTFFLGDKYTKPLNAKFLSKSGKSQILQMGSYGLGLSRILAASIEILSSDIEMRWPDVLIPYNVIILPPKEGSKEEQKTKHLSDILYETLEQNITELKDNVLIDDRIHFTIGRRYMEARRIGYRYIIVINAKAEESNPVYEFSDLLNDYKTYLNKNELLQYIKQHNIFE